MDEQSTASEGGSVSLEMTPDVPHTEAGMKPTAEEIIAEMVRWYEDEEKRLNQGSNQPWRAPDAGGLINHMREWLAAKAEAAK